MILHFEVSQLPVPNAVMLILAIGLDTWPSSNARMYTWSNELAAPIAEAVMFGRSMVFRALKTGSAARQRVVLRQPRRLWMSDRRTRGSDARVSVCWASFPSTERTRWSSTGSSHPLRGSGGHTTLFRLVEHIQRAGHVCRVYLYDVYGADAAYYGPRVRKVFPGF